MFLSIATAHPPATGLGFLLHKHPGRLHQIELTFGKAWVFYPEASQTRCEAVLVLDVDPISLVRGKAQGEGLLDQYVNDRPYAATSFLSVALNKAFRTAMTGACNARQELAGSAIPLEAVVTQNLTHTTSYDFSGAAPRTQENAALRDVTYQLYSS